MWYKFLATFALLFVLFFSSTEAKVVTGRMTFNKDNRWGYIDKFGFDIGRGSYELRAKVVDHKNLKNDIEDEKIVVQVFLDERWDAAWDQEPCSRGLMASTNHTVKMKQPGNWFRSLGYLSQKSRPHMWYITADRCGASYHESVTIEYELTFMQENGSHFSVELKSTFTMSVLLIFGFMAGSFFLYQRETKFLQEERQLPLVMKAFNVAFGVQFLSHVIHLLHLWSYGGDGVGMPFLDGLASFCSFVGQIAIISVLLLIGNGFTITYDKLSKVRNETKYGIALICAVELIAFFVTLTFHTRHKFSDYDGVVGNLMFLTRVGALVWNIVQISKVVKTTNPKTTIFMRRFALAGTLYFVVFPVLYLLCVTVVAPYWKHRIIYYFQNIGQVGMLLFLFHLFLSNKSDYMKIATITDILPGLGR